MGNISLREKTEKKITIMIFLEGTVLKPKSWIERFRYSTYRPIGNCVEIIKEWQRQGAEIVYCSSQRKNKSQEVAKLLIKYDFVGTKLYYRRKREKYRFMVEKIKPNILIEDNCKSIGGSWQMCITRVNPQIRKNIVSIVVNEFKGIDNLPLDLSMIMHEST